MKNILITGIAGFIGFHLAKRLQNQGHQVIGIDNFNDYYKSSLKIDRSKILEAQGVKIFKQDIGDYDALIDLLRNNKINCIIHLAAQAGVRYSLLKPREYIKANIDGFLNILEACRELPNIQLIYASSSSVYGLNTKVPFEIEDRTDHQANLYGVTKKTNELMAQSYHHLYGISSIGLRFFTVYGPWGRPDMAYYHFAKSIIQGDEIHLFNNGQMQRDFTYIDDIVEGIISTLDKCDGCQIFNLGNSQPQSLMTLVECLEKALGIKAKIRFSPMQPGEVLSTFAEISSSQKILNFNPKTALSKGIEKFVQWFQEYEGKELGLFK